MFTRFSWLLGGLTLLSIGLLVACSGSHFSASSDGLVVVPTQGAQLMQSFTFDLSNGHVATISDPPGSGGVPTSVVVDPAGAFAYVILDNATIASFAVNSNGRLAPASSTPDLNQDQTQATPVALAMDQSGKYLFVAEGLVTDPLKTSELVHAYSVSNGSLTLLPNTFTLPITAVSPNFVALSATPVSFPASTTTSTSACSAANYPTPTREFLYAADSANDRVWEIEVDMASGTLKNPGDFDTAQSFPSGSVPAGVAVDACNRFVYVANSNSNNLSAYSICNGTQTSSPDCIDQDGTLVSVTGSPYTAGNGPGPIVIDPFANFVYVLDQGSFQISGYRISQISGQLTALSPATTATGSSPKAIAVRGDGNWLFVSNYGSASVSQYALTPASGLLTPQTPITTDNNPWGVAVK